MFPIQNMSLQTVGFGGRVMDDSLPKYLNSPETPVYNKRRLLYGMHAAKKKCREKGRVYIVEGYFDQLSMFQRGIENVAATLGTALTSEHIQLLKGFVKEAVLIFDSDAAGIKASERSVGIFIKAGVTAKVIMLPRGHDPDSYVSEFGAEGFYELSQNALDVMSFLMKTAVNRHGLTVNGKLRILKDLAPTLASIHDRPARQLYVKELSELLGIDEMAILEKVREGMAVSKNGKRFSAGVTAEDRVAGRGATQRSLPAGRFERKNRLERQIVAMMIQFPEILPEIERQNVLDFFMDETLAALGNLILANPPEMDGGVSELVSMVDDGEKRNILASLSMADEKWNLRDGHKIISKLITRSPKRYELSLKERIREAEKKKDSDLVMKLLDELQQATVSGRKQMDRVLRQQ
jgi:DNA primase